MSEKVWERIEAPQDAPKCNLTGAGAPRRVSNGPNTLSCFGGYSFSYEKPDTRQQCIPGCEGSPMIGFKSIIEVNIGTVGSVAVGRTQMVCPQRPEGIPTELPRLLFLPNRNFQ